MSVTNQSQRFSGEWEELLESQADEIRRKVPETDGTREEQVDLEELDVDEIQEADMMGSEAEHIAERETSEGRRALNRDFTIRHMQNISEHKASEEVSTINMSEKEEIASVKFDFGEYGGVSDVDVGASEKEEVTDLVSSVDDMIQNMDLVEQVTVESNPDPEDVQFRRQGHLTEMMIRGSGGDFDWDKADRGIYPGQEKISGAPRYFDFDLTYPGVMQVAGTGSIQTTMRPKIYEEHEGDPDAWIRDFSGGGDRIGMHALSPLIYGPFQGSSVVEEVEIDGETEKVIEVLNGRDKAYGQGFQSDHDLKGLDRTVEGYITENSKAGYSPELEEIRSMEDAVNFPATSGWTFSNAVEAGKMKVVEEGETYDPEADYETLDEATDMDIAPDEAGHVRVGHDDWDIPGDRTTIDMDEFPDYEMFEGTVHIVDEDGNREQKRVVVDYRDEEMFPDMDDEEFMEVMKGHYSADATAVWEPFRMRPDKPAFEYRDMCNNPFRDAGMATQVGAFRRWREIQEFAEDQLGITSVHDAQELRLGVDGMLAKNPEDEDYHEQMGMDYTVNDEYGITLQDAWLGDHEQLDTGMIDIISDGLRADDLDTDLVTGEAYSVDQYREQMTELVENGLTPGEMMAKQHGVEIEGEVMYDENDIRVGG